MMCLLMAAAAVAQATITLDASVDQSGNTTAGEQTLTKDGITLHVTNGILGAFDQSNSTYAYRVYPDATLTVSSTVGAITNIEFTCAASGTTKYGPGCMTADCGTYTYADKVGTWAGSSSSIKFTASTAQVRAHKIVVTVDGTVEETMANPTFTPAAGTYYSPVNVEINCGTTGASIYYTTDGTTPSASSTAYTEAIALSENTTLKAIAIKGDKQSEVAEAAYVFKQGTQVASIAAYNVLDDGTMVQFTIPVTALAQSGSRLFVKDETGYMLIFGNVGKTYNTGDIIPAGFSGQKTSWDGEPELKNPKNFAESTESATVTPVEANAAYLKHENFAHYVVFKNATISGGKIYDAAGAEVAFYCNMGANLPSDETKTYDIYGIVGSHGATNTVYQLLPTEFKATDGSEEQLPEVADVEALYDLNKGINARIKSDLVAIFQHGNRLLVKNNDTYTQVYGPLTETFENGDIIRDAVASWSEYQGAKQLVPVDSTFVVAEKGAAVEPVEMPLEEMGQDMVHTYFLVKNATIAATETENTFMVNDGTMDMKAFNQFGIEMPEDLEAQYDIKCFLTVYKQELELYPVEIVLVNANTTILDGIRYSFDPATHTAKVVASDSYAGLTDVVIPATVEHDGEVYTVTGIADGAFRGCDLRSVSLYADITEGGNGFDGCTVGTLYVAASVTAMQGLGINPSAIYCFGNTPAQCDGSTFASYDAALHVPVAAMTDYFLAEVWSSFNNITADAGQQPETLTLDRQEATLELGASLQLTATVAPATVVPLRWASSNPAAVTVTDDGRLTALQAGEADITVTCMGLRQQCHVTVQGQAVVATIDPQELTLERGQSATLTATTSPIDAAVTWRSTDPAVATVTVRNGQATVDAVTTGEALIIATPEGDNVVPDTCRVTVTDITVIVTLDQHALKMKRGETVYLTATTSPITADVTYSSSDTNVALVRVVGGRALVLANRPGEALIVATTAGELVRSDTCRVTVRRPKGDVNNDGLVDAGDVNNLINIVLGKVSDFEVSPFTDLTGDGTIDVADVNWLINIMLGKVVEGVQTFTVNGVSFKMVEVEGGTFTMGATAEQGSDTFDNEYPAHQVTLSDYHIGQTEVTQELWQAVMGSNPSYITGDLQRPVVVASWDDCQTFITKLNQMTGKNFRLPTEAEWEYAARGGNRSRGYMYSGSDNIDDVAWFYYNSYALGSSHPDYGTHSVATKAANELGLYDMSGNVWEWCQDWYGSYSSDAQINPTGPASGSRRVFRGGCWWSSAGGCRVSYRARSLYGINNLGLRLAL